MVDEVSLEVRKNDISLGTARVEWVDLGDAYAPRLVAFDDSWATLAAMTDLVTSLGDHHSHNLNPIGFCELLKTLGFEDVTPTA